MTAQLSIYPSLLLDKYWVGFQCLAKPSYVSLLDEQTEIRQ